MDMFSSFYVKLLTSKQRDRQTNAGHYIMLYNLIGAVIRDSDNRLEFEVTRSKVNLTSHDVTKYAWA